MSPSTRQKMILTLTVSATFIAFSCKREERAFTVSPPNAQPAEMVMTSDLQAGGASPVSPTTNAYEQNAYAIAQGQQFYEMYNCVGCHAHGAGGMGPALMDDKWIYGSNPEQIHATIIQGRPNGMPSFHKKIPDYQVWQITAYVRSLSGLASPQASPGREDHMSSARPPNSTPPETPKNSSTPEPR
jgi:cytochrome c oxidase cbb3-type subunit III